MCAGGGARVDPQPPDASARHATEAVQQGYEPKYAQWRSAMVRVLQQQRDCPLLVQPDVLALLEEEVLGG